MRTICNPSIKLKETLDSKDYADIKNLEQLCAKTDDLSLKLELDFKINKKEPPHKTLQGINECMYYAQDTLIGYIGICQYLHNQIEVTGMVHPEYRRRGVFNRLFSLVSDEWKRRNEVAEMLLLADNRSPSGKEFIKHTGAHYANAEYEMFLKPTACPPKLRTPLIFRKATNSDARNIAQQNAVYFETDFHEADISFPEEQEKDGIYIYLAELDNRIIGKVQVEHFEGIGGIYGLGVLPEHRGKGYGKALLTFAITKLQEDRVKDIKLQVLTENEKALTLYTSCGFETVSTMNYYSITTF